MHVAPPEDRLEPALDREPPVVAQHRPELRVGPSLDAVVGRGNRSRAREGGVQIGEGRAGVDESDQRATGLHEPLVGGPRLAVLVHGGLRQERVPALRPRQKRLHPAVSLLERRDREQRLGQPVELDARRRLWPCRGAAPHLRKGVEHAPLAPRPRPGPPQGLGEAVPTVRDDDLWGSNARHQRRPGTAVLGSAQVPAEGMPLVGGDEHDGLPVEMYAVDKDNPACRLDLGRHRPYLPEPRRLPAKRPASAGHVRLTRAGEKPGEKGGELLGGAVDPAGRARIAGGAPPPRPARARLAVPRHPPAADRAIRSPHVRPRCPEQIIGRKQHGLAGQTSDILHTFCPGGELGKDNSGALYNAPDLRGQQQDYTHFVL